MPTNNIITNDMIAEVALPHFINNCKMIRLANNDYEKEFERLDNGYKKGDTVRIQTPSYYPVTEGEIANPIGITEFTDHLTLQYQMNITFETSTTYLTTNMADYERRAIMPATIGLANAVDTKCILEMANTLYLGTSTIGTPVNSFAAFTKAQALLKKYAVPEPYSSLMNIDDANALRNSQQNAFNTTLNSEISIRGIMGDLSGVEVYEDQNMQTHTNGVNSGTPLSNGATQSGASIITDGWTASTTGILKKNDLITFAGVYGVNPVPPNNVIGTGSDNLMTFRVTADVNSDGSGNATIPIDPPLTTTGVYATGSTTIANNSAITVLGNSAASNVVAQNFMFDRSCCSLAIVPLMRPEGAVKVGRVTDEKTGVSFRIIDGYDIITNQAIKRMDILFGVRVFPKYGVVY